MAQAHLDSAASAPAMDGSAALAPAAAIGTLFMGSTLLTPLYGLWQRIYGFSPLTLTLLYAVYVVGNLSALLLVGRLSDQVGRRRVALAALAVGLRQGAEA